VRILCEACWLTQLSLCADSIVFLFLALLTIGISLYLPQHLWFIIERGSFYLLGDSSYFGAGLANTTEKVVDHPLTHEVLRAAGDATTKVVEAVAEASGSVLREL
jgi:hypothetical protein